MSLFKPLILLVALGSGLAAAHTPEHAANTIGEPGRASAATRTVEVTMSDAMRFSPANVKVRRGETIRFVLKNEGRLRHEMVLGSIAALKEHAALMLKYPQMEHAEPNQASVEPGSTGELVWRFTQAGTVNFACLQAGHYEAGMKGQVEVARAPAAHSRQQP